MAEGRASEGRSGPAPELTLVPDAVHRIARKHWICTCVDPKTPWNHSAQSQTCLEQIRLGDHYIEYLDNGIHRSGVRYCLPCGVALWSATLVL